jgi:hypothetical protein
MHHHAHVHRAADGDPAAAAAAAGDILVNGLPKQQATWARQVGYVEQMDIHSAHTTVEEALWFSGRLRLPPSVTDAQVSKQPPTLLLLLRKFRMWVGKGPRKLLTQLGWLTWSVSEMFQVVTRLRMPCLQACLHARFEQQVTRCLAWKRPPQSETGFSIREAPQQCHTQHTHIYVSTLLAVLAGARACGRGAGPGGPHRALQ